MGLAPAAFAWNQFRSQASLYNEFEYTSKLIATSRKVQLVNDVLNSE